MLMLAREQLRQIPLLCSNKLDNLFKAMKTDPFQSIDALEWLKPHKDDWHRAFMVYNVLVHHKHLPFANIPAKMCQVLFSNNHPQPLKNHNLYFETLPKQLPKAYIQAFYTELADALDYRHYCNYRDHKAYALTRYNQAIMDAVRATYPENETDVYKLDKVYTLLMEADACLRACVTCPEHGPVYYEATGLHLLNLIETEIKAT